MVDLSVLITGVTADDVVPVVPFCAVVAIITAEFDREGPVAAKELFGGVGRDSVNQVGGRRCLDD